MKLVKLLGGRRAGEIVEMTDEHAEGALAAGVVEEVEPGAANEPPPPSVVEAAADTATIGQIIPPLNYNIAPQRGGRWAVTDAAGNLLLNDAENKLHAAEIAWLIATMSAENRRTFLAERAAAARRLEEKFAAERRANPGLPGPTPVQHLGELPVPPVAPGGEIFGPTPEPGEQRRRPRGAFFT